MSTARKVKRVAKAISGGVVAGLTFLIPVVDDGLVASEIGGIALAVITGFGAVYFTSDTASPR